MLVNTYPSQLSAIIHKCTKKEERIRNQEKGRYYHVKKPENNLIRPCANDLTKWKSGL
jgi:hypothetical protein